MKKSIIVLVLIVALLSVGYLILSRIGADEVASPIDNIPAHLLEQPTEPADEEVVPEPPSTADEDIEGE